MEENNKTNEVVNEVINNDQAAMPVVDQTKESGVWQDEVYDMLANAANRDNANVNVGLPEGWTGTLQFTDLSKTYEEVEGKDGSKHKWVPVTALDIAKNDTYSISLSKIFRLTGKWSSTKATARVKQLHSSIIKGKAFAKITDSSWEQPTATRTFVKKNLKGNISFE